MMETPEIIHQDGKRKLPDGWRWVQLSELSELAGGDSAPQEPEAFKNGTVPFVRMKDVGHHRFTLDLAKTGDYLTEEAVQRYRIRIFPPGTILLPRSGSVYTNHRARLSVPAAVVGHLAAILPRDDLFDSRFVTLALRLVDMRQWMTKTTGLDSISFRELAAVRIPFPPLVEQKRIAAIMNERMATVERARAAAEAQLEAAKGLPAAYLRAIFNSPEAQKWPRKSLGETCEIVARQVDPKLPEFGALPHVNGENIESGTCRLLYLNTAAQEGMRSGKYLFEAGDVLYSKLRPYLRKVAVVDFRGVCSADMYPIRVNRELLDPHFAAWLLLSDEFTRYADDESRRARMPKLNRDQLFAWSAPAPPLAEQRRIASMLSEQMAVAERTRKPLEEQLDTINKLPATLLRRAFAGEF